MTTLAIALARIAVLEARLDALESGGGASSTGGRQPSSNGGGEALPDHVLEKPWADKTIAKDPKQWKGPKQVGRRYSRAPSEWLRMAAGNMDFKAMKGREENPPRLRNDGKPWYESDEFEAKLLRAWALRNDRRTAAGPATTPGDAGGADDFNFGANVRPPAQPAADDDVGF